MNKKVYAIDGNRFNDLDGFFEEIHSVLTPKAIRCTTLDCFNDIIRGGFGTPDEGFILVWKNAVSSRKALGYGLTAKLRQEGFDNIKQGLTYDEILQREYSRIKRSFPDQDEAYHLEELKSFEYFYQETERRIALNHRQEGETIFDEILEIIRQYPKIELKLE